eukprot:gene9159-10748_t
MTLRVDQAFGVTQVVVCWANKDLDTEHTWAFFANGCACVLTGLVGVIATFLPREKFTQLFFIMSFLTTLEAFIVFIIFSKFLPRYLRNSCGGNGVFNEFCSGMRVYLATATGVFWCWIILLLPMTTYFSWRYTVLSMKGQIGKGVEMEERSS